MFYYLKGRLEHRDSGCCVIDCGGVGYMMTVSMMTSEALVNKLHTEVKLYTHLAVREDGIELFGFGSVEEKECYNQLTSVSGVGPKAAISILSTLKPDALSLAICTEDVKAISKAPGIGAKTAARIVLELKDKVSKNMMSAGRVTSVSDGLDISVTASASSGVLSDAIEALMLLGYDKSTAINALKSVDPSTKKDAGELIKAALKKLAR